MSNNNYPAWEVDTEYTRYTLWFLYACIIYSIIGFSWGVIMGGLPEARHFIDYRAHGDKIILAHAHINLLGWVEMAIFASVYFFVPRLVKRSIYSFKLVKVHFWIHNIGLIGMVMLFTIAGILGGQASLVSSPDEVEELVKPWMAAMGVFGTLVLLANCIWGYNIFRTCAGWERDVPVAAQAKE